MTKTTEDSSRSIRKTLVKSKLMKTLNMVFAPSSLFFAWDKKYRSGASKEPEKDEMDLGECVYAGEKLVTGLGMVLGEGLRVGGYVALALYLLEKL